MSVFLRRVREKKKKIKNATVRYLNLFSFQLLVLVGALADLVGKV